MPKHSTRTLAYLNAAPSDLDTAREQIAPYRALDGAARIRALTALQRAMDQLLAGRVPSPSPADREFWRRWIDPLHGRTG